MLQTTIFRNENKVSTEEVLKIFRKTLEENESFKSGIEELVEIVAKNPSDKFIVSAVPTLPVMQGDLLIWSELTDEFKRTMPLITNINPTDRMVLQDGDSLTGDHRLVPIEGSNFTLSTGEYVPEILKNVIWGSNHYDCKILDIDCPFVITHREHGNIALPPAKYIICSSLNSETLTKMKD